MGGLWVWPDALMTVGRNTGGGTCTELSTLVRVYVCVRARVCVCVWLCVCVCLWLCVSFACSPQWELPSLLIRDVVHSL